MPAPLSDNKSTGSTTSVATSRPYYAGSDGNYEKERNVYRVLSLVFAARGQTSCPQRARGFRRTIHALKDHIDVADLLRRYGEPEVLKVAQRLAADGVFDSKDRARDWFPHTFSIPRTDVPTAKPLMTIEMRERRRGGRRNRRRDSRKISRDPSSSQLSEPGTASTDSPRISSNESSLSRSDHGLNLALRERGPAVRSHEPCVPDLYPICLPFDAQTKVLMRLRCLLQLMFKEFVNENSLLADPDTIWGADEVEDLYYWWQEHQKQMTKSPNEAAGESRTIDQLSLSIAGTHLALLHKVLIPVRTLNQFTADAVILARMMEAELYERNFEEFRISTESIIDDLEARRQGLHLDLQLRLSTVPDEDERVVDGYQERRRLIEEYQQQIYSLGRSTADEVFMLSLCH